MCYNGVEADGTDFLAKLQAIHRALAASGYRPRSKEEIDAQLQAEREGGSSVGVRPRGAAEDGKPAMEIR